MKIRENIQSYLAEEAVYSLINNMVEETKYCSDVMKYHFNKEVFMTKKNNEDFMKSAKYWICDNAYIKGDVKVRDHSHVTGNYRGS